MTPAERVVQGAEFLDEFRPGWADEIDVEALDLASSDRCVLGQIYGSFRDGLEVLGLSLSVSRVLGLNYEARSNKSWLYCYGGYDAGEDRRLEVEEAGALRAAWDEEIGRRR